MAEMGRENIRRTSAEGEHPRNCQQHKCHPTEQEDARPRPSECVFFRPKKPSPAASRERERDDSV